MKPYKDYQKYPEFPLRGRVKKAYDWLSPWLETIVDVGCSYGYATRFLKAKAKNVVGIDPNEEYVSVASRRYPEIEFRTAYADDTGLPDASVDAVVMLDVLEHVPSEKKTLDEIFRILKPGGTLIITTPHKGLFGFMDPEKYIYFINTRMPWLYNTIYKIKNGRPPEKDRPGYDQDHRHYSLKDFQKMLESSKFKDHYTMEDAFKSGLYAGALNANIQLLARVLPFKKITETLTKPFDIIASLDYWVTYGRLSYNIAVKIRKN